MQNITESLTFLAFARRTLAEAVGKLESKDFLLNEASDYEVLHLLVTEKFPEEKENIKEESKMMNHLKQFVLENKNTFTTFLGPTGVSAFMLEVDILSHLQLSSSFRFVEENIIPTGKIIGEGAWKAMRGYPGNIKKTYKTATSRLDKRAKIKGKLSWPLGLGKVVAGVGAVAKTKEGKIAGASALAIATIAGFAAHKLYQRYSGQFARQCKKAEDKNACIRQAKVTAMKAEATALKSSMSACSKSKEPEKCKMAISAKIDKIEAKIAG